jgi:Raf kinase inhibitor-like YbhB/YbcL family protein
VHWVLYNIPTEARGFSPTDLEGDGAAHMGIQGLNDFGELGYGGPCPPADAAHRYFFKLYALDEQLVLEAGASKDDVVAAMEGHVLDQAELVGTYQRS